ncbi:MAG: DinB family protein [Vicinamibacterales bacterium]
MSATKTERDVMDVCDVTTAIGVGSARAESLATRLEQGARALGAMAADLTREEWTTRLPGDGRPVGVVVHHVASVYPIEIDLAQRVAKGQPIEGVTMADVHAMNARHAVDRADTTVADALALLLQNSRDAAAAIRALGDAELDRVATASLYSGAPVSCQFVLEDHAVRHSYHHLSGIARALGRALPKVGAFLLALGLVASPRPAAAQEATLVDTVRAATRDLRRPSAAIEAGWTPATGCVSGPQSGAMGVHYINPALLTDGALDAQRPEALIYETKGGRTTLVGAEFIVIADQWHAVNGAAPPILKGQHFHLVSGANRYGLPPFYELHVWAWKDNPNGTFADWHAHVTCDAVTGQ